MKAVVLICALWGVVLHAAFASAACNLSPSNGITCVQSVSRSINAASSGTLAFTSDNTVGNLIVVVLFSNGGDTVTPTDSRNTYQAAFANQLQSPDRLSIYYAQNIGAGANTVSVSAPGATSLKLVIFEFSGLSTDAALDQAAGTSGTSSVPSSPTVTTTTPHELAIGAQLRVTTGTISAGTGYSLELCRDSCTSANLGTEDEILSSAQSVAATWAGGTVGKWSSIIATFRVPFPKLPQAWADDREPLAACPRGGGVTKTLGVDYASTGAGVNQAISDWVSHAGSECFHLINPHGNVVTGTSSSDQIILLGKSNLTTGWFIIDSDTPLTSGQTVCSHQIIDNSGGSSPRNLGCTNDIGSMGTFDFSGFSPGNSALIFQACTYGGSGCSVPPSHYAVFNQEIRPKSTYTTEIVLTNLDDGDTAGTHGSSHIWFEYDYFHGDATDTSPYVGNNKISNAVAWESCSFSGAAYNYADRIIDFGSEGHIFTIKWSSGPLKFVDNWLEGASSSFLTAGSGNPNFLPNENIFDLEVRNNRFTKPAAWMTVSGGGLVLKNNAELKSCTHCLFDGNIFEYSSTNGAQKGQGFTITPRNTSGGNIGNNYNNATTDITFTNNIIRHVDSCIESDGRSASGGGNGGGASQPARRWNMQNVLCYDVSPGAAIVSNLNVPFAVELGSPTNTWTCTASRTSGIATYSCASAAGQTVTTMSPGDLVDIQTCSDTSFNTLWRSGGTCSGTGSFRCKGTLAIAGTDPNGLTVVTLNAGPDTTGITGCKVSNEQGFPQAYSVRHWTIIGTFLRGNGTNYAQIPSCSSVDTYAQNFTFQDNLVAPNPTNYIGLKCQGDGNTEGTTSEQNMTDITNLALNHDVIVGRLASSYTDYPGGGSPSTASWFPPQVVCTTAMWDSNCIGFSGMMNDPTLTYQPSLTDYHGYVLDSSSAYKAGGSRQASDGQQVGANIGDIDTALTLNQYSCSSACGTGPYPNN